MNLPRPSTRSGCRRLFTLLVIGMVGSLWAPVAHAADNTLVSSNPADGTSVDVSPSALQLTFSSALGATNQVTMTCGPEGAAPAVVTLDTPTVMADQATLLVTLLAPAPKGDCNVGWRVSQPDGSPGGNGSFTFTILNDVAAPSTTIATGTTTGGAVPATTLAPVTDADGGGNDNGDTSTSSTDGPLGLFRLISGLGLAVMFGSLVLIAVAWPEGVEYILTVRFLRTSWIVAMAGTFLFVVALTADLTGTGLGASLAPTTWGDLLDTTPGKAAMLRFLLVAASAWVVMRPERSIDPATQLAALALPGLAVVTMAFSRADLGLLDYAVGAVHAASMAIWVGGLILLSRVVLAGPGEEDLVHAVRGFARISIPALLATVVSGGVLMLRFDRGALSSSHGLVMIVKALFVALMVFVGVAARQFINQRVTRVDTMTAPLAGRLRRALGMEAAIGIVVLALSAWLLALTPPNLSASDGGALDLGATHRFASAELGADVEVAFSERVGTNDVRVEVVSPATGLSGLVVDFVPPPGSTVSGMTVNVPLTGAGAAVLEKSDGFVLSAAGSWTVVVRIGAATIDSQAVVVSGGSVPTSTTGG